MAINGKKPFFNERSSAQIARMDLDRSYSGKGITDKILKIDPAKEAVEIEVQIIPGQFYQDTGSSSEAARKAYKHGIYMNLKQPTLLSDALEDRRSLEDIARNDLDVLKNTKEGETDFIGYAFRPIQGMDKRKRLVPFAWLLEGTRIFTYAIGHTGEGIPVKPYSIAKRVAVEGTNAVVGVPAREDKKSRYTIRIDSVPVTNNEHKLPIALSFSTTYSEGRLPEHSLWSFGYKKEVDVESSRNLILYPHDVAAMHGIARHYAENEDNAVPWDMNVFLKPSKLAAEFYNKLCNNVIIRDPHVRGKNKLRKLYITEKSILLGRLIGRVGSDEAFWKLGRDPEVHEYDWSIPTQRNVLK